MECRVLASPSSSSSVKLKKFPLESIWSCHFCGVSASPDASKTCGICKVSRVHMYCLVKKFVIAPEIWVCEECNKLSSFQQELPDHLAIQATWKGSFEILDSILVGGTYEGLQAHLPRQVRRKAYEVANEMPNMLQLKLYPRSDVWPAEFNRLSPTVDDIALYFLPGENERFRKTYHLLSNVLMVRDSAIRSSLDGWELLIFSSNQLPADSHRINNKFFLWGVFQSVGNRYSSSQPLVRTQNKCVSSALCNYDYGTNGDSQNFIKGDDTKGIKFEIDIAGENSDQRIDDALSNSYGEEKKIKVGGNQVHLLTPKREQPGEFDAPLGFMTPITNDGYATSPALLLEAPPGFCKPMKPKERSDYSDETSQKLEASDTMGINALWSSKRQRSIRGTSAREYLHDLSFQPQKPTKVAKSPEQADFPSQYHQSHGSTGIGIRNDNFVIVAGDGKAFGKCDMLDDLKHQKVHQFSGGVVQMWGARAGYDGECTRVASLIPQFLEEAIQENDQLGFIRQKLETTPGTIDDWIFVFGGFQTQDDGAQVPFLFSVEPEKSEYGENYYACGSGSKYALRVLRRITSPGELTVEEAIIWVERALLYAAIMDHCTGGRSSNGVEVESKKDWILTDMLDDHIDYFKEAYQNDEKDSDAHDVCDFFHLRDYKNKWIDEEHNLNDGQWMDFESSGAETEEGYESLGYDTEEPEEDTDEPAPIEPALSGDEEPPTKKTKT